MSDSEGALHLQDRAPVHFAEGVGDELYPGVVAWAGWGASEVADPLIPIRGLERQIWKKVLRNRFARAVSPRDVPPLKRPVVVRTRLAGSNSSTAGRPSTEPAS